MIKISLSSHHKIKVAFYLIIEQSFVHFVHIMWFTFDLMFQVMLPYNNNNFLIISIQFYILEIHSKGLSIVN